MFDIGFWELALIGAIALLVVGPERLPGVARNVGKWVGRIRRYVTHVKQDIERELHADEVRELLEKGKNFTDLREVAEETASVLKDARSELDAAARTAREADSAPDTKAPEADPDDAQPERRIPHHAVDEDLFAPSNLTSVTPEAEPPTRPEPASDADTDPNANNEHPTGRQGQH